VESGLRFHRAAVDAAAVGLAAAEDELSGRSISGPDTGAPEESSNEAPESIGDGLPDPTFPVGPFVPILVPALDKLAFRCFVGEVAGIPPPKPLEEKLLRGVEDFDIAEAGTKKAGGRRKGRAE
jgi:hypothetical protein